MYTALLLAKKELGNYTMKCQINLEKKNNKISKIIKKILEYKIYWKTT